MRMNGRWSARGGTGLRIVLRGSSVADRLQHPNSIFVGVVLSRGTVSYRLGREHL